MKSDDRNRGTRLGSMTAARVGPKPSVSDGPFREILENRAPGGGRSSGSDVGAACPAEAIHAGGTGSPGAERARQRGGLAAVRTAVRTAVPEPASIGSPGGATSGAPVSVPKGVGVSRGRGPEPSRALPAAPRRQAGGLPSSFSLSGHGRVSPHARESVFSVSSSIGSPEHEPLPRHG